MTAADFLLVHLSRALWDPVDTTQVGSLDPRLHAKANGEVYRFSRPETRARFQRDPVRWCGLLRDPVSEVRFMPDRRSPRFVYRGGPYFFACDSTYAAFRAHPERYAIDRRE